MTADSYAKELHLLRSLLISTSLQRRRDIEALELIQQFPDIPQWDLGELNIEDSVWEYVRKNGYDPKVVLCHPDVILYKPITSLYYRGLAGLSIKTAKTYMGAIESLEQGNPNAHLSKEKALLMAQTYNSFICPIIKGSKEWTPEDGYRNIIANLGISLDGSMRNKIGEIAEDRVATFILEWLNEKSLIIEPDNLDELLLKEELPSRCLIEGDIDMKFGSEPDISFIGKNQVLLVTVEIKGGTDPAAALERYGAAKKSFQHAIDVSPRCVNFYLGAVFTNELENRMDNDRLVHKRFNIVDLLKSENNRNEFFNELFHHSLRII